MASPLNELLSALFGEPREFRPDRLYGRVDEIVEIKTLSRFIGYLRLGGRLVVDQSHLDWRERVKELSREEISLWAQRYWKEHFAPRLDQFLFLWRTPQGLNPYFHEPRLQLFSLRMDGSKYVAELENLPQILQKAGLYSPRDKPSHSVYIEYIQKEGPSFKPEQTKENRKMLHASSLNSAGVNTDMVVAEEMAVMAALDKLTAIKSALAFIPLDGQHDGEALTVKTQREAHNLVRLSYSFKGQAKGRILGFRSETSFAANPHDQQNSGKMIVDDHLTRHVIVELTPGHTYYYSFFINEGQSVSSPVRFCLHLPTPAEEAAVINDALAIEKMRGRLNEIRTPKPAPPNPADERVRRKLEELRNDRKFRLAITAYVTRVHEELAADPDFQRLSKKDQKKFIQDYMQLIDPNEIGLVI